MTDLFRVVPVLVLSSRWRRSSTSPRKEPRERKNEVDLHETEVNREEVVDKQKFVFDFDCRRFVLRPWCELHKNRKTLEVSKCSSLRNRRLRVVEPLLRVRNTKNSPSLSSSSTRNHDQRRVKYCFIL